jgi:hypothetical protein
MPVYQIFSTNPYQQNIKPTVTYVPMINLKLGPSNNNNDPVELNDAIQQQQYFLENGNIVQKHTSLIYSRGVLIFFVDRRANIINTNTTMNPIAILNFPSAVSGFERLNDREVHAEHTIKLRDDEYNLRSVVLSEVNNNVDQTNLIIGSSTLFIYPQQYGSPQYLQYDPYGVIDQQVVNGSVYRNEPIVQIPAASTTNPDNFMDMSRKRGIIFIYQLVKDATKGQISF